MAPQRERVFNFPYSLFVDAKQSADCSIDLANVESIHDLTAAAKTTAIQPDGGGDFPSAAEGAVVAYAGANMGIGHLPSPEQHMALSSGLDGLALRSDPPQHVGTEALAALPTFSVLSDRSLSVAPSVSVDSASDLHAESDQTVAEDVDDMQLPPELQTKLQPETALSQLFRYRLPNLLASHQRRQRLLDLERANPTRPHTRILVANLARGGLAPLDAASAAAAAAASAAAALAAAGGGMPARRRTVTVSQQQRSKTDSGGNGARGGSVDAGRRRPKFRTLQLGPMKFSSRRVSAVSATGSAAGDGGGGGAYEMQHRHGRWSMTAAGKEAAAAAKLAPPPPPPTPLRSPSRISNLPTGRAASRGYRLSKSRGASASTVSGSVVGHGGLHAKMQKSKGVSFNPHNRGAMVNRMLDAWGDTEEESDAPNRRFHQRQMSIVIPGLPRESFPTELFAGRSVSGFASVGGVTGGGAGGGGRGGSVGAAAWSHGRRRPDQDWEVQAHAPPAPPHLPAPQPEAVQLPKLTIATLESDNDDEVSASASGPHVKAETAVASSAPFQKPQRHQQQPTPGPGRCSIREPRRLSINAQWFLGGSSGDLSGSTASLTDHSPLHSHSASLAAEASPSDGGNARNGGSGGSGSGGGGGTIISRTLSPTALPHPPSPQRGRGVQSVIRSVSVSMGMKRAKSRQGGPPGAGGGLGGAGAGGQSVRGNPDTPQRRAQQAQIDRLYERLHERHRLGVRREVLERGLLLPEEVVHGPSRAELRWRGVAGDGGAAGSAADGRGGGSGGGGGRGGVGSAGTDADGRGRRRRRRRGGGSGWSEEDDGDGGGGRSPGSRRRAGGVLPTYKVAVLPANLRRDDSDALLEGVGISKTDSWWSREEYQRARAGWSQRKQQRAAEEEARLRETRMGEVPFNAFVTSRPTTAHSASLVTKAVVGAVSGAAGGGDVGGKKPASAAHGAGSGDAEKYTWFPSLHGGDARGVTADAGTGRVRASSAVFSAFGGGGGVRKRSFSVGAARTAKDAPTSSLFALPEWGSRFLSSTWASPSSRPFTPEPQLLRPALQSLYEQKSFTKYKPGILL